MRKMVFFFKVKSILAIYAARFQAALSGRIDETYTALGQVS